jgi:hypothetical protein
MIFDMKLKTHGRYDYSALTERKDCWPDGKRLARPTPIVISLLCPSQYAMSSARADVHTPTRSRGDSVPVAAPRFGQRAKKNVAPAMTPRGSVIRAH